MTEPSPSGHSDDAKRSQGAFAMYERFCRSAAIDIHNWRDPSYDFEAIELANPEERLAIESFLVNRGVRHGLDVQALAMLNTPSSRHALTKAFQEGATEIRAAVARFAPALFDADQQLTELLGRIAECDVFRGLSLTLEQIESCHPPSVVQAMLQRVKQDPGVVAVHFAALLLFLHGQAALPFDWDQRDFFLRFNPGNEFDRKMAFEELCQRIGAQFP